MPVRFAKLYREANSRHGHPKEPALCGFFCARKTVQNIKRAGGCEYWSLSLLAFWTRVIGMSR